MRFHWFARGGKMLALFALVALIAGAVVMLLWNALVPELFRGPSLSYWQAVGLFVLSKILLRGGGMMWRPGGRDRWKKRFEEKLAAMAPEDRDKFREEWNRRCGHAPEHH